MYFYPTLFPSISPTLVPTFTNNTVYVRSTGCDYGYCTHSTSNYLTDICINHYDIGYAIEYCCQQTKYPTVGPTTNPTHHPSNPSLQPTLYPTIEPTTSQPTYNKALCGDNRWCYNVTLHPIYGISAQESVIIRHEDPGPYIWKIDSNKAYFDIHITSQGDCNNPMIDFQYELVDYDWETEYLSVIDNNNELIKQCRGGVSCGIWYKCINQYRLANKIINGSAYTLTINQSSSVDAGCYEINGNPYAVNAILSISCTNNTSPTQTITLQPTPAPSIGMLHCGDTNVMGALPVYVASMYYSLQLDTFTHTLIIDACGSNYDTYLYLFDSNGNLIGGDNHPGSCGLNARLEVSNVPSGKYQIAISSNAGHMYYDYPNYFGPDQIEPHPDAIYEEYTYSLDVTCLTSATTLAPTQQTQSPTLAPTLTPTYFPTCKTIHYAWHCFFGIGGYPTDTGCAKRGYDGNGVFDIGDGAWNFSYFLKLVDSNIIIRGQGSSSTFFNYNGNSSIWFSCATSNCWLGLEHITIKSSRNSTNDVMFDMVNGGTLVVKDVIFNGENYMINDMINSNTYVTIKFEQCVFSHHNLLIYTFKNGANVIFTNCTFQQNIDILFNIQDSTIIFKECRFRNNNIQTYQTLFNIQNTSNVDIINTEFIDNMCIKIHNS